ncbi:MAG: hypothetical protein RR945_06425 [Erysipelotrichaceae bacterium]
MFSILTHQIDLNSFSNSEYRFFIAFINWRFDLFTMFILIKTKATINTFKLAITIGNIPPVLMGLTMLVTKIKVAHRPNIIIAIETPLL